MQLLSRLQQEGFDVVTSYGTGGQLQNISRSKRSRIQIARTHFSVDDYCAETRTFFEFMWCFWHGCKFLPFRDLKTLGEDTLAERYESTMTRIE